MGCNCGDNEYNIRVNNNGSCEPTTPVYNITLGNVGVNGYSPVVNFVNQTEQSFSIEVDDINGIDVSDPVPKLSYVSDQLNNINTTIANLGDIYLTVNGSNANLPFSIGNLRILTSGDVRVNGNLDVTSYLNIPEIRPRNNSGITIGYTNQGNYPINLITNDKAYYNGNEIATINNLDTRLKTDGSNADNGITLNGINLYTTGTDTSIGKLNSSNILQDGISIKSGQVRLIADRTNYTFGKGLNLMNGKVYYTLGDGQQSEDELAVKGDIPTVGNGTITITQGGVAKGTFTTNQSGNTTIELDAGGDITNKLDKDGSNADANISINGNTLASNGIYRGIGNINIGNKTTLGADSTSGYLRLPSFNLTAYDSGSTLNTSEPFYINGSNDTKVYYHGTLADNEIATIGQLPSVYNPTITFTQGGVTKGTITLNQSTNQTIALDAGGSGGGAVDSVNGQTGTVVLTASDVGALPDTTVIPTKTSDLTNDSGYITTSALNNYVTNSTLTTTLADYQPLLVSGTNIKTINNTSLLGSGNINTLVNTATKSTSLSIGDNASTLSYTTNVGIGSQATATAAQAFGHYAIAGGQYSLALGQGAETSSNYAIQLGKGTNATATTLSVGFGNNGNYQLLNGTTGLIPDERISSNIARTSNIPDVSNLADTDLSNLSTTGQAVIDGKVSKSGDTMTGDLNLSDAQYSKINSNITFGTPPSGNIFTKLIEQYDSNNNSIGFIETSYKTNGTLQTSLVSHHPTQDIWANINVGFNANGNKFCTFPDTECCDGQWVKKSATIASNVSTSSTNKTYSLSSYLPNDGYSYEVLFWGYATTAATSGKFSYLSLSTDLIDAVVVAQARTRTSSAVDTAGACILPVGTGRRVVWNASDSTNLSGTYSIYARGYRRIGTNS